MQNPKLILATHNDHKLEEFKKILYSLFAEKFGTERAVEITKDGVIASAKGLGLSDVIEDGSTFEENAYIKAKHVFDVTEIAAIADDSGLVVDILGNAPGIFSARWSGKHGDDLANVELLLAQLSDVPQRNRTARFVCAVAVVSAVDSSQALGVGGSRVLSVGGSRVLGVGGSPAHPQAFGSSNSQALDSGSTSALPLATPFIVRGEIEGVIAEKMSGINGFGYDPIFIPNEQPTHRAHAQATNRMQLANNTQAEGAQAKGAQPSRRTHTQDTNNAQPAQNTQTTQNTHEQPVCPSLTFAEFTAEQKNAISHRARAIEKALFKIEELCRA
jgi:XTP/dITP diphosphohydrolase